MLPDPVSTTFAVANAAAQLAKIWFSDDLSGYDQLRSSLLPVLLLLPKLRQSSEPNNEVFNLHAEHVAASVISFRNALASTTCSKIPTQEAGFWPRLLLKKGDRALKREVEARIVTALDHIIHEQAAIQPTRTAPWETPFLKKLVDLFTRGKNEIDLEAVLVEESEIELLRSRFTVHWSNYYHSDDGAKLRALVASDKDITDATILHDICLDVAHWKRGPIFPEGDLGQELSYISIEDIYVQPYGTTTSSYEDQERAYSRTPILELIEDTLATSKVIIVSAPFGHGKSLTAKVLAADLATRRLAEMGGTSPTTSHITSFPIYVHTGQDLRRGLDIDAMIRSALRRHTDRAQDNASHVQYRPELPVDMNITCLIDAFDEITLTEDQIVDFMQSLGDDRTNPIRFVVFTRPFGVGALRRKISRLDIPVIKLHSFIRHEPELPDQVEQWLKNWSTLHPDNSISSSNIDRSLLDICHIPILLFMIAYTHTRHGGNHLRSKGKNSVYEDFLRTMAKGKLERIGEQHKAIADASEELDRQIRDQPWYVENYDDADRNIRPMLWLMGRIAWLDYCREQAIAEKPERIRKDPLQRTEIATVIKNELNCSDRVLEVLASGVMLAMQTDLLSADAGLLFGHQSFRDFLVARHWRHRISIILDGELDPETKRDLQIELSEGSLATDEPDALDFLVEFMERRTDNGHDSLYRWCADTFHAESIISKKVGNNTLFWDLNGNLRLTALALQSRCAIKLGLPWKPLVASNGRVFRSLLAWLWMRHPYAPKLAVIAPRFKTKCAQLNGAKFTRSDLRDTVFEDATMHGMQISGSDLSRCRWSNCDMSDVRIMSSVLDSSSFQRSNMTSSFCRRANGDGVSWTYGTLRRVQFDRCAFPNASFRGATIDDVEFRHCDLRKTVWDSAIIENVRFIDCWLQESSFSNVAIAGKIEFNSSDLDHVTFELNDAQKETGLKQRLEITRDSDFDEEADGYDGSIDQFRRSEQEVVEEEEYEGEDGFCVQGTPTDEQLDILQILDVVVVGDAGVEYPLKGNRTI